jgi:hypothetical protein
MRGEIVGSNRGERSAVASERSAEGITDVGVGHG